MNKPEYDKNKAESFLKNIKGQSQNIEVLKPSALNLQSVQLEQDTNKLLELGKDLVSKELFDDAIVVYETALKKDPENPNIKYSLAKLYYGTDRYLSCLKYLKDVIKYSQDNENPRFDNDFLQLLLGHTYYHLEYYDKCIEAYEPLLEKGYKSSLLYYHLAYIYYVEKRNNEDTALDFIIKACELDPQDSRAHFFAGFILCGEEQLDESLQYSLKAEELGCKEAFMYGGIAWIYLKFEEYEKAYFYAKKAVEADENYDHAWAILGDALDYFYYIKSDENYPSPVEAYKKAIDLGFVDNGYMTCVIVRHYWLTKDLKSAQYYAQKGLAISKDKPWHLISQAMVYILMSQSKKGFFKTIYCHKALQYLNKALKIDKNLRYTLFIKGIVYLNMNKYKKALETFLPLDGSLESNINLAVCFFQLKNYTQTEIYLKKILDADSNDPDVFEFAAHYLYFYKNNKKLGAAYARKALELENTQNPDDILQIARMIVQIESGKKVSLNSLTGSYKKHRKKIATQTGDWGWLVIYYLKLVLFAAVVWCLVWKIYFSIQPIM